MNAMMIRPRAEGGDADDHVLLVRERPHDEKFDQQGDDHARSDGAERRDRVRKTLLHEAVRGVAGKRGGGAMREVQHAGLPVHEHDAEPHEQEVRALKQPAYDDVHAHRALSSAMGLGKIKVLGSRAGSDTFANCPFCT